MSKEKFQSVEPHPNFSELEEEILKFWEKKKIFEKSLAKTKTGKPFTFYDGPPFATGLPHYGHILASTIKDLIPRYQTMRGRFVRRRWGWDCHGLPIEELVERELGVSGKKEIEEKVGIKKFNETCRSMVLKYVEEWGKVVRRIARWIEFDNSYKTMDRDYMESVWWAFKEIYGKGLVYEGRKVLLYCPRCETPISNFEVAMDNSYKTITEESVIVKFQIINPKFQSTYFLSWTTTPWTLPGNVALAVGEKITYVNFRLKNYESRSEENYIVAKDLLNPVIASIAKQSQVELIKEMEGKNLVGLEYEPLFDVEEIKQSKKSFKVYAANFVTTEEGTGIVHTAVVYGEEDYELGQKVGLPVVPLLDEKGSFNEKAPELIRGRYFKDADPMIVADLEKRGLLFDKEKHTHSYPHCWRCETALFYNAIPAWFINIQKIKKQLLNSNTNEIDWYPEHLKHGRYQKSVEAAPDWNISRNRYWGNPIPVWKCGKCKKNTVIGSVKELKEKAVSGFSEELDLHRPYIDDVFIKCDHCGAQSKRITEIFDSWMEAGSMPFAEYHYPFENKKIFESRFPAQFVAEYIAQTRAWFYVMHVVSIILFDKAPFENVVATGTILAEDGSKLSKSKRNFPDPIRIADKYGIDSLRFYLMNSVVMQGDNLNFNERDLATINRRVIRILWNVYSFFITYANKTGWDRQNAGKQTSKDKNILDEWVAARTQALINSVTKHLDSYDTVRATREIGDFVNDLSTWYIRRSRGRKDEGFFVTLYYSLIELSKIIAPFMPFLAEKIYQNLHSPGGYEESVHLTDWPETRKLTKEQTELLRQMEKVREVVEQAHSLRAEAGIKLRQPLASLTMARSDKKDWPEALIAILKDEVNVTEITVGDKLKLDTTLTKQLEIKGLARELERQIQDLRKASGLRIGELVELYYETGSAKIRSAMKQIDEDKIYVSEIKSKKQAGVDFEKELTLEKVVLWLGLKR